MKTPNLNVKAQIWSVIFSLVFVPYAISESPCQLAMDGDLNRDCKVNMADVSWFASLWLEDWSSLSGAFLSDGIYVATPEWGGDDIGGCGNMFQPCETITFGILQAGSTGRDYVFVADGVYPEYVNITQGINLWGGFSPVTWVRQEPSRSNTILTGSTVGPHAKTLIADSITFATEVSGFQIKGAEATQPGGNSYAVWIRNSDRDLVLEENHIYVGRGADGLEGTDGTDGSDGLDGQPGLDAKDTSYNCFEACPASGESAGGAGGALNCYGTYLDGGDGARAICPDWDETTYICLGCPGGGDVQTTFADGQHGRNNSGGEGLGGLGGYDMYLDFFCNGDCSVYIPTNVGPGIIADGQNALDGSDGSNGNGGAGAADSQGSVSSGEWQGASGALGRVGTSGGGGAGGGVEHYPATGCAFGGSDIGGSGGGGGAGGCRGTAGNAGGGGGGAFGIFVVNTFRDTKRPTLTSNTIYAGRGGGGGIGGFGGTGGSGGQGGPGGGGGVPASDYWSAGAGGNGGHGGAGGHGGGGGAGAGGISCGLYTWNVAGPLNYHTFNLFIGAPVGGDGGKGGKSVGNDGSDGATGDASNYLYQ